MKLKKIIFEYRYVYSYFIIALLIDLIGIYSIERKLVISNPSIIIVFLLFITFLIFLLKRQIGSLFALLILLFQSFLNIVFKMVYVMQGQTVFSFTQLKFIKEGTIVVSKIKIDYLLIINYLMIIIVYCIIVFLKSKNITLARKLTYTNLLIRLISIILISIISLSILSRLSINTYFDYDNKAYSLPKTYKSYGVTGNALNELFNYKNKPTIIGEDDVMSYLFTDMQYNQGVSLGNNLIVLMVETLEWYSFIKDDKLYPNGLNNLDVGDLDYLFPNLTNFYNNSVKVTNYYSKETTLYSENLSILGHHTYKTVPTYDHTYSDFGYSLPNMFKKENPTYITNYFHNNNIAFYGRGVIMPQFGFDNVYGAERLFEEFKEKLEYSEVKLTESYLNQITDSSMFDAAKEKMFPIHNKFLTFITTLTMHGSYEIYHQSLEKNYEKLDSINIDSFGSKKESNYFRNYLAAVVDFDKALGIMMDYLKDHDLLSKTTIVLFSDHHAYSNNLTYYVRGENFNNPIVFNVPCMIYDENIGNHSINKFTTNIDLLPTILDIFGIDYFKNLYYGTSVFDDNESISYSYYYDSFLTDKILFKTLDKTLYSDKFVDSNYRNDIEGRVNKLFEKIKYIDQWYYYYSKKGY